MNIYTYIMSAHIHTYTYIHTRIQNVQMNARKARLQRWRGSDCAGSPTWHQEALPFSLSASRQRAVQTTSAYLHWCWADPPSSLSTPAPSLAMPAHDPPKRGHFSAILAGFLICSHLTTCKTFGRMPSEHGSRLAPDLFPSNLSLSVHMQFYVPLKARVGMNQLTS